MAVGATRGVSAAAFEADFDNSGCSDLATLLSNYGTEIQSPPAHARAGNSQASQRAEAL
jgi:hypothetical protein